MRLSVARHRCLPRAVAAMAMLPWRLVLLALLVVPAGGATVFTVLMRRTEGFAAPIEYFEDLEMFFQNPAAGLASLGSSENSFLSKVDVKQDLAAGISNVLECNLDPFWEKGAIVTDTRFCPLSTVKLVVWSLMPAVAMFFGVLGAWSRQRNVGGRGKETKVGSLIALGLVLLSVAYDWFFSWTLFRAPRGSVQSSLREVGLAHMIAVLVIDFIFVHFWFRRKFLVGMPWYEYHKHGIGMHAVFLIMYAQPQAVSILQCRLFNADLFNVHFGTPSKMNEVLSNVGCLSLLNDVPQIVLQFVIWMADAEGKDIPQVTRVSMGLSVLSIALVLKRQYVASVERRWYKEIVRMAGVRRLTTYGGASRWLKFQKRPSAAADVKAHASTSQQQLFLAWMQSMGRRQESIAGDASNANAIGDGRDELSEDSEDDIDSLSASEEEDEEDLGEDPGEGALDGEDDQSPVDDDESEGSDGSVELQAYRDAGGLRGKRGSGHLGREEPPLAGSRRRLPGPGDAGSGVGSSAVGAHNLLGFARGIVDDMSESGYASESAYSESDIFAYARNVAGRASESGIVTESTAQLRAFRDDEDGRGRGRRRGHADDMSDVAGSSASVDFLQYARQVANRASESGVGSATSATDIFALARQAAENVSESGAGDGASISDIFDYARRVANGALGGSEVDAPVGRGGRRLPESSAADESGAQETDIFTAALRAAEAVSRSGVGYSASGVSSAVSRGPVARRVGASGGFDFHPASRSGADGESQISEDIFAAARRAAEGVSQSGVGVESDADSDIFAAARAAAVAVSRSGITGASASGIVASRGQSRQDGDESSAGTDVFAAARRAALEASESGVGAGARLAGTPLLIA
eukprot:TRINITY_DN21486_c0_g1_i2.p1 TRINITY_DN21486_c0_g1~~TRINITY_DN21486_c0_g1_i2.p1  ORF type:complete len:868 (+),score=217.44 TRINITY_DN21486_c0_g1_i2:425-3028(+)